jgi:hypothetical protein
MTLGWLEGVEGEWEGGAAAFPFSLPKIKIIVILSRSASCVILHNLGNIFIIKGTPFTSSFCPLNLPKGGLFYVTIYLIFRLFRLPFRGVPSR